jgi:hypothetical protein
MKLLLAAIISATLCLPQFALAASTNRIEIRKNGETVATIGNLSGQLQVRADKSQSTAKNAIILSGNVIVTAINNGKKIIHLRADEVLIDSALIEIQVYDYRYDEQMGWVNHLDGFQGEPQAPREALLKALKDHPQINSFRMRFGLALGGIASDSTILYDRHKKTLKYYEHGVDEGNIYTKHYLYTDVTDKVIEALFQKYARTDSGYTHGNFGFLTEFGSKRIKL